VKKKNNSKHKKKKLVLDQVHIDTPSDGSPVSSTFSASGSGSPDGATVTGILTDTATGATIQSNPASAQITQGTWNLSFQNVPAGSYVLAVNETDPNNGADAVNITVNSVVGVTMNNPTFSGNTATVTGNCDSATTISAVIASSRPKFGNPVKQKGKPTYKVTFSGLTSGTIYTMTVYPIRDHASGKTTTFTMP
jgi:hypothetical protein